MRPIPRLISVNHSAPSEPSAIPCGPGVLPGMTNSLRWEGAADAAGELPIATLPIAMSAAATLATAPRRRPTVLQTPMTRPFPRGLHPLYPAEPRLTEAVRAGRAVGLRAGLTSERATGYLWALCLLPIPPSPVGPLRRSSPPAWRRYRSGSPPR